MITIREDSSKMLGGGISIFLSFDFNQNIINMIKSCDPHDYCKETHEWEVTINSLAYLLDNLVYFDSIKLILRPEINSNDNYIKPTLNYKSKPFNYQLQGIEYGLNNSKWLLLDQPGLGKTLQMIYLAEELKVQKGIEHCLIICGLASLRANWEKEIKKHSTLNSSSIVIGKKLTRNGKINWASISERANQLKEKIDEFFVIINIESFTDVKILDAIVKSKNKFDMIVVDEIHKIKNSESKRGKALLKLEAPYKVGLTGTMIMNSPIDCYSPLVFINKEKRRNLGRFKGTFCIFSSEIQGDIIGFKNMDILKSEIESCSLRRLKSILKDLPPKSVIVETLEMDESHAKFYEGVVNGVKEECDKIDLKANNILSLTTRLRQATSCPSVLTSQDIVSTKIERCLELVEEIVSNGDKVVVMSNFKEPIYQLEKLLAQYKPLIGTGDLDDSVVANSVAMFQEDDEHMVMLGTSQKLGTGIDLNKAKYMICLDECWTSALQEQVESRIWRANNIEPCFVYRLICENTIDEKVEELVNIKQAFSDYVIDDKLDNKTLDILKDYIQSL